MRDPFLSEEVFVQSATGIRQPKHLQCICALDSIDVCMLCCSLSAFLQRVNLGDCVVEGEIQAYSCKPFVQRTQTPETWNIQA